MNGRARRWAGWIAVGVATLGVPASGAAAPAAASVTLSAAPPAAPSAAPSATPVVAPAPPSPLQVDWPRDLGLSVGALALSGLLNGAVAPSLAQAGSCRRQTDGRCAAARLVAPDRWGLGRTSRAWQRASDGLQAGGLAAWFVATGGLAALQAAPATTLQAVGTDVVVVVQAVALSTLATDVLKYAVRRPRPASYRGAAGPGVGQVLSFPSGHTSAVAAASSGLATVTWLRHADWRWRAAAVSGAVALQSAMAASRVLAGEHFVTDVAAGALLGAAVGLAVPLAHRRAPALGLTASPAALSAGGVGLQLSGAL